ncbi:MAG: OmpH family outer membrane protein [Gammaproteobacteria bacterium]|nr:OmpH family outer membrane protein [Gammaproteobacteria bacterium]
MKKVILTVLASVFLLNMSLASASIFGTKVAVFDLHKVLQNDPAIAKDQTRIKQHFLPAGQQLIAERKALQADMKVYKTKKNDQKLAAKIKQEGSALLTQQADLQRQLIAAQRKAMQNVLYKIKIVVKEIAAKKHIDLVLTKNNVAYNKAKLDITDLVIAGVK